MYPKNLKLKLISKSTYNKATGCLEWDGGKVSNGYGLICVKSKFDRKLAHRVMLELRLGRPLYYNALHDCNNPACISVAKGHVKEGTQKENLRYAIDLGRKTYMRRRWHQK